MKKLINVLWAIEKDLHVIASNTEAFRMRYIGCDDPGPKGPLGNPNVSKKKFVPEHSKNKMSDKQIEKWFKHTCI